MLWSYDNKYVENYQNYARTVWDDSGSQQTGLIAGLRNIKGYSLPTQCFCLKISFFTHSVQFSRSVMSGSLQPCELQHARPPCPSPTPGVHPNPCPSSRWCHPTISSSVVPFSSCPWSFPASGSFQMSQRFASGDQNVGVSASTSVLPMNTQDWSPCW